MSILIKGIDMPKECKGIELVFIPKDGDIIYNSESMSIGAEQIAEIPTPHGRLVDANKLEAMMYHEAFEIDSDMQKWDSGCWIRYKVFENCMNRLLPDTIIEAEE